ncbi:MAG: hypothetical protein L6R42_002598 [Xanthoria sp. 1 TBL-2021]|nr:MAG: hypothetical protein L6R42_002598 [Xanthoria sp. 1 TBL-2021]
MGDPVDNKQRSKPDWQHEEASGSHEDLKRRLKTADAPEHVEPPPSRAVLLEQAFKFLEDDEIKDAPTERKIAFLQSKGLTDEEVHRLLEIPYDNAKAEMQETGPEQASSDPSPPTRDPEAAPSQPPPSPSPTRDTPPIITYPEFLLHSEKPPPLITASRLINAFYIFSGTTAAIYGTSKYLVEPMLESLTSARHDLFSTAQSNLDGMVEKLEQNVSTLPSGVSKGTVEDDGDTSSDESTENTTPFFNRTVGTQTSPPASISPAPGDSSSVPAATIASLQHSTLGSLQKSLLSIVPTKSTNSEKESVADQFDDLKRYLSTLQYPSLLADGLAETKDDAVNKFKAEIRSMKGVLLNARNFPSGNMTGKGFRGRVGE